MTVSINVWLYMGYNNSDLVTADSTQFIMDIHTIFVHNHNSP